MRPFEKVELTRFFVLLTNSSLTSINIRNYCTSRGKNPQFLTEANLQLLLPIGGTYLFFIKYRYSKKLDNVENGVIVSFSPIVQTLMFTI